MKILITGSRGFIGNFIYNKINNNNVIGIDLQKDGDNNTYHQIDITDLIALEKFIKKNSDIDVIIHAAALAHKKGSDLSLGMFKKINFEGTAHLIDLSNKYLKLKRFIFFSTISVYGERMNKEIYVEDDELFPQTPYAVTKKMCEEYIIDKSKFNYTILRFAPVYGDNFFLNIDRRTIIKNFIYRAGKGEKKLSLLNVMNISDFLNYLLSNRNKCINQIYNVADKKIYSYNELIDFQMKKRGIKKVISFPEIFLYAIQFFGKIIKNNFIIENTTKLLTDKIYSTHKLESLYKVQYNLDDILMGKK